MSSISMCVCGMCGVCVWGGGGGGGTTQVLLSAIAMYIILPKNREGPTKSAFQELGRGGGHLL